MQVPGRWMPRTEAAEPRQRAPVCSRSPTVHLEETLFSFVRSRRGPCRCSPCPRLCAAALQTALCPRGWPFPGKDARSRRTSHLGAQGRLQKGRGENGFAGCAGARQAGGNAPARAAGPSELLWLQWLEPLSGRPECVEDAAGCDGDHGVIWGLSSCLCLRKEDNFLIFLPK